VDFPVPALPVITDYFHGVKQLVQLTISSYLLGYGVGQLFGGIISDVLGRKKIIIFSEVIFIVISFLSVFSPNIYAFNIYRFLQGCTIGGILANCRAIVAECFFGSELAKILTYMSLSWALGPIVGPVIGSYLQSFFDWQANFYFFTIFGIFVLVTSLKLSETNINLVPFSKIFSGIRQVISCPIFLYGTAILAFIYSVLVIFNVVGPFLIQEVLKYCIHVQVVYIDCFFYSYFESLKQLLYYQTHE